MAASKGYILSIPLLMSYLLFFGVPHGQES
jgi:hypothetical protein